MRDKFNRFMLGRYGVDSFAKFTLGAALVLIVLALFTNPASSLGALLDTAGIAVVAYTYFRILSRNIQKRSEENRKFLSATENIRRRLRRETDLMKQRKDYHIYTCPGCGQKIRIPRGKGKIEISCPKCHTKFVKRS